MIDSCIRMVLDIRENRQPVMLRAKRGDTGRVLRIGLSDGGVPYPITADCQAVFTARKQDGTTIFNPCTVEKNEIIYAFTEQTCTCVGRMIAEIRLYGEDNKLLTSAGFLLDVGDTVWHQGDVESRDEMDALDALILETVAVKNEVEKKLANGEFVGPEGPRGPQGFPGQQGEMGPLGPQGPKGDTGPAGPAGERGPEGPMGPKGEDGSIAFEELTPEQMELLRGPQGIPGPEGQRGPKGETGTTGPQGPRGDTGPEGPQGPEGQPGKDGQNGRNGEDGQPGLNGLDGVSPVVSVEDIAGGHRITIQDANGTKYIDVLDGKNGSDGQPGTQGPKGDTGATGPAGPKGDKGDSGEQGTPGTQWFFANQKFSTDDIGGLYPFFPENIDSGDRTIRVDDFIINYNGNIHKVESVFDTNINARCILSVKGSQGETGPAGEAGSQFFSSTHNSGELEIGDQAVIPTSKIDLDGRTIRNGDFVILTDGKVCKVNQVQSVQVIAKYILSLKGEPGESGGGASTWEDLGSKFEEGVVLEETSPIYNEDMGGFLLTDEVYISSGKTYTVNWNGVEYSCVCQSIITDEASLQLIGNLGAMGMGDDTGEPFLIGVLPSEMWGSMGEVTAQIYAFDGSESVILSITGPIETIIPIPIKYLPQNSTGSVFLYVGSEIVANADRYLYNSEDISNAENRLTREQLLIYIRSGRTIYVHDPDSNMYMTGNMIFSDKTENVTEPYMYITITTLAGTITAVTAEKK